MYINKLSLLNFRNYNIGTINFDKGINIIYGENAQGKTNLLEAIYLCATSKSYRTLNDKEMIKIGKDEGHINVKYNKNNRENEIDIHLRKNSNKGIALNKIPIRSLNQLLGNITVIMFSPEDLGLIKNGPKERRKFINIELCQLSSIYYYNIKQYNKVLKQRNNLLKLIRNNRSNRGELEVWDVQLLDYGKKVIEERDKFIKEINPIFSDIHYRLSGNKEKMSIIYETNTTTLTYEKKLKDNREKDIIIGSTSIGPHKDDIKFLINNIDIRKYGSQGQQRTAALSLKLSEIELVKQFLNESPILLLDDVLSELDKNRQKFLIKSLEGIQTIITCTGVEDYIKKNINIEKMYYIKEGNIVEN
jgi:DNA replication and repair protein RecF